MKSSKLANIILVLLNVASVVTVVKIYAELETIRIKQDEIEDLQKYKWSQEFHNTEALEKVLKLETANHVMIADSYVKDHAKKPATTHRRHKRAKTRSRVRHAHKCPK